jgi:hypothetical protein
MAREKAIDVERSIAESLANTPQFSVNPAPSQFPHKLPKKEDMQNVLRFVDEVRKLSDVEQRYVFRELAKDLLDPHGESQLTICDNNGNVLGYFDPVAHRMRERAKHIMVPVKSLEELLEGSEPFEDSVNRILHSNQTDED